MGTLSCTFKLTSDVKFRNIRHRSHYRRLAAKLVLFEFKVCRWNKQVRNIFKWLIVKWLECVQHYLRCFDLSNGEKANSKHPCIISIWSIRLILKLYLDTWESMSRSSWVHTWLSWTRDCCRPSNQGGIARLRSHHIPVTSRLRYHSQP